VAIGHLGGLADSKAETAKAVCKRGAFVGFDRQGGPPKRRPSRIVRPLRQRQAWHASGHRDDVGTASLGGKHPVEGRQELL